MNYIIYSIIGLIASVLGLIFSPPYMRLLFILGISCFVLLLGISLLKYDYRKNTIGKGGINKPIMSDFEAYKIERKLPIQAIVYCGYSNWTKLRIIIYELIGKHFDKGGVK